MKVLHLFGDWKWTGPAEPTLDLCVELKGMGVDVALACPPVPPEASTNLPDRARERGLAPSHEFTFNKKLNIRDNVADMRAIRERVERDGIDLVHVHFTHDHIIGALGLRGTRARLVRTNHKGVSVPWLLRRALGGYLTYFRSDLERSRLKCPAKLIAPGMKLDRFDPARPMADMRARFGVDKDAFVVGVVARMQRHRRFDILLEGVKKAAKRVPGLRVLVVGRGTHMKTVAVEPVQKLGLEKVVTFTGYLADKYVDTVAAFDALLFLVPGSDGTCRALREAMAMGKAVIGARRGMIPDIVDDGKTGLVIDDSASAIASAIETLAGDRRRCREMGRRGREKAVVCYDMRAQARAVKAFYEEVLATR